MNVLLMSLLYPEDQLDEVTQNAKDKLQNQINNYQRAFIEGIRANLRSDEKLDILNSLPVGIYPMQYRKLILKKGVHDSGSIRQLGCINLPWFKQKGRMVGATIELEKWVQANPNNRTVLLYTQYLPYMEAVLNVQKHYPDLKACVIITDLPNEWGLSSGRKGLLKKIEYALGKKSLDLCRKMNGFVLLTKAMAEVLKIEDKPSVVIEGLITSNTSDHVNEPVQDQQSAILYTGTLEPELGIQSMLDAFVSMPEYELWICGQGSMQECVKDYASRYSNIRYFGFVPQKDALALQAKAAALINPRTSEGLYTRYSFPSKTLEYLRAAKPVLCFKLEGIPDEYDAHLRYINSSGADGIVDAVRNLMSMDVNTRTTIGQQGRQFVLEQKNPAMQCIRLLSLLRSL